MENLYHLITEDFRYGGNVGTQPTHNNWTNMPYLGGLIKETWNGSAWVEGATPEEIAEANKELVPATISQMKLRKQLILSGISISAIDNMIAQLPQPQKDLVYTMWEYAVLFDRNDETLNAMASMLNITQEQLDNIFIYGNKL